MVNYMELNKKQSVVFRSVLSRNAMVCDIAERVTEVDKTEAIDSICNFRCE